MKIEKRSEDSGFISHNNLTIFFDRQRDGSFKLQVNRARVTGPNVKVWDKVGHMMLDAGEYERLLMLMNSLKPVK